MTKQLPTGERPSQKWSHWPGQLCLHPDTRVLSEGPTVSVKIAMRWALVATRWDGNPWWYGYAPVTQPSGTMWGWWLLRRNPEESSCTTDSME